MKRLSLALFTFLLLQVAGAAQAALIVFTTSLSGPAESPPNASPGTGTAVVAFDNVANTMSVEVSFSGLLGTTTAAHIHCCFLSPMNTAGVATMVPNFSGFPLGVTSGTYDQSFDLLAAATYNPAFIAANGGTAASARDALLAGMIAGNAYFNIHTSSFGGGEIRGFFTPVPVPEPGTVALMGLGVSCLIMLRRRRYDARRGG